MKRTQRQKSDLPAEDQPALILTGQRDRRKYRVIFRGRDVWLTAGEFAVLCLLVRALLCTDTGLVVIDRKMIWQLRAAFDKAMRQKDLGKSLIHNGDGGEYHLTLPRDEVAHHRSFRELRTPKDIDADVLADIIAHSREVETIR